MKNIIGRIAGGGAKIATYLSIAVKSRLAVAALAALAAGGAWATECLFSNVDQATTAAVRADGLYTFSSFNIQLSNPSALAVSTTTFPSTGTALISSISMVARSNDGYKDATTVKLTGATSGRVFTGTIQYFNSTIPVVTSDGIKQLTCKENRIFFDEGDIPVNVTESYKLEFFNSSGAYAIGSSVVNVNASGNSGWQPALRIYGSTVSSSPEATLTGVPVTISGSGATLLSGASLHRFTAFMKLSNIPEASGRIFAINDSQNNVEIFLAKTETGFKQSYLNAQGAEADYDGGSGIWKHDTASHWVAVTFDRSVKKNGIDTPWSTGPRGTCSYIDGVQVAAKDGLMWSSANISALTIGGASKNNTDTADSMVVEAAYQFSEVLTAAQVATVTKALQNGWTPNSSGTALTGTNVVLPGRTETVTGTIVVAPDGTYAFSGTMPSSLIASSGSVTMPATVTVGGTAGVVIGTDGTVTIRNAGVKVALSGSYAHSTVMAKVSNIPSAESRLVACTVSTFDPYVKWTGAQFTLKYLNSSGSETGSYYYKDWMRDAGEHWIAVTYTCADNISGAAQTSGGTRMYLDGANMVTATGLKWSGGSASGATFGCTGQNSNYPSTGMVLKDAMVFNGALTDAQIATVTAALNKGWAPTVAAGTTLGGVDVELPDGTAHVTGQIVVAPDGTYTFSGGLQVLSGTVTVTSGTTLTSVAGGATVLVNGGAPANLEAAIAGGYALSATLNVPETIDGTIALVDSNGNEATGATSTYENGVRSFTGTAPANPTYTGSAWWWDYEFDEDSGVDYTLGGTTYRYSMPNTGSADTTMMSLESLSNAMYTDADDRGNREVYFQQTPWRNASFSSLTAMTAVMYCQPGNYANTVLVGFGSTTASGKTAIALVTGDNPANGDMKLVLVTGDSQTVTPLATLKAVDATTKKHLYAFVMDRITEDETEKTRVRVYLDGKVKAIYKHSGTLALSDGFQIGSLHGGVLNSGLSKYSLSGDSGTLDFLRVFNGSLSSEAMEVVADAYKYESTNGSATRDPVSSAANWVDTDAWTQSLPGASDTVQNAPNSNTQVTLSIDGSSAVSVALNLDADTNYESLAFDKEDGATGSLELTSAYGAAAGKLVAAETSVKVDTVVPAGRIRLGITTVAPGVTLTVSPFSPYGNTGIQSILEGMVLGEVFEETVISLANLGAGASVVLDSSNMAALTACGFTAELDYTESNQSYTFRITREAFADAGDIAALAAPDGSVAWTTKGVKMPAPATIPATYGGTLSVHAGAYDGEIEIATSIAGGNITLSSGTVNFTGTITTSGAVSLTGSGTIPFASLPGSLTFGAWTGTVALPAFTGDAIRLNNYGIAGSTVRVSGSAGWLQKDHANVNPNIELGGDWTLPSFSASFANTLAKLSGAYKFTLGASQISYENDSQTPYFLIKDVSDFTGSLETTAAGIVLGAASKPTGREHGGKILVYGNVTVGETATWTAPGGVLLADANARLTVPSGAHVPELATGVAGAYVKETSSGSAKIYTVSSEVAVSDVSVVSYGDDFATATIRATVGDASLDYKLKVGGKTYEGVKKGSTVEFSGVETGHAAAYDTLSYSIAAAYGETAITVSGGSGTSVVADSTAWIAENETNTGNADAGGLWSTDVTYTEGKASVADNTFTATEPSTGDRVVLKFDDVVYPALSDMTTEISKGAQGAFSVGEVLENEVVVSTNFYILAREDSAYVWKATTNLAELDTEYDIVMTIDYATKKYSVSVGGTTLSVGGSTSFDLCADNVSSVSEIEFKGSGTLSSINGETSVGYMVKDVSGSYYATIAEAIAAFDAAKGPYTVLHAAGTPPSGWQLVTEAGVTVLQKLAKLMIFMVK